MSRPPSETRARPTGAKALTTFTAGILVGLGMVSPALPATIDLLYSGGVSFGTAGKAVMAGVLLLVLVMVGFATLFQIFVLIDW